MKLEDEIYFSNTSSWDKIASEDSDEELVKHFFERIQAFYINPAEDLLNKNPTDNSFASGVILLCLIEHLGSLMIKDGGFKNRLIAFLKHSEYWRSLDEAERKSIAFIITEKFRNGLVHNGRVKDSSQLS